MVYYDIYDDDDDDNDVSWINCLSVLDLESCKVWLKLYEPNLFVDGANGIGANKINQMRDLIKSDFILRNNNNDEKNQINISTFNDGTASNDVLNHMRDACAACAPETATRPSLIHILT